ncbi:hypothetical protein WR25_09996 [Diploscapter pachys]|uniref:Uncharacterized protein n=1 Tax=Diploscapter pachys TaxID=2018661 RepID=A0A2A2JY30_9BILA|nr:hypothetical protein WR25_09996 [Diploscapter pachys]
MRMPLCAVSTMTQAAGSSAMIRARQARPCSPLDSPGVKRDIASSGPFAPSSRWPAMRKAMSIAPNTAGLSSISRIVRPVDTPSDRPFPDSASACERSPSGA